MEVLRRISLRSAADGSDVHLQLRGDETTPLRDLPLAAWTPDGDGLVFRGRELLDADLTLATLQQGEVLGAGGPVAPPRVDRAWTRWELRVIGGPVAGLVVPLPPGRAVVGRGAVEVALDADPLVSRAHLVVTCDGGGAVTITDEGSANGTLVDGERLEGSRTLEPGQVVRVGNSLLVLSEAAEPELPLVPQAGGGLGLNRRFRPGAEALLTEVHLPEEPQPSDRPGLNLLMVLAPAVAALALALVTRQVTILLFMALGPIVGLGSALARRRSYDRKKAAAERDHAVALGKAEALVAETRRREVQRLRVDQPDPAAVVQCARANGRLLWARRAADDDFLLLRLGSGRRRSAVQVRGAADEQPFLWQAPVSVSLRAAASLAVVGGLPQARALARSLVLQAATLHAPVELKVVVLSDDAAEPDWGWCRWLPHARWGADEEFVLVGSDQVSTRARLAELNALLKRRQEQRKATREKLTFLPAVLVVVDGVGRLAHEGLSTLLREGPDVGIHLLCLDETQVPEGCRASVTIGRLPDEGVVEQAGLPTQTDVLLDGVSAQVCDDAARCLAPLRLIGEESADELPAQLRLLDLLGLSTPTPEAVQALWKEGSRRPTAIVGLQQGGRPLVLDLTKDGPHGIIAGASRSGKSEFLKTLIAALAAQNHPDDLSFLFIDFKGGNDYQVAATLPHTVDLSTQLDPSGFERSLRLLDAEIVRRTRIAGALHASTLEGYWAAQEKAAGPTPTLGRLVVIVDEFAELAQKSPEQLDRLVSVARVGAAYGVHLILATQRPAGVVSGQIDANAPLRVCFRTTQREHSMDVLGVPDAAEIAERHRGRGFKRAHNEPPIELQCARVGNARPGSVAASEPPQVCADAWQVLGRVPAQREAVGEVPDPETDFYDLAVALREAAVASGWTGSSVPWPKPLPTLVDPAQVPAPPAAAGGPAVTFALADDPELQAHVAAPVVLGAGHVAVVGAPTTGRTTALRTVAASLADRLSCAAAHLYAIDFAGGGLSALAGLAHCGGVASANAEVAGRILDHLEAELRRRQSRFEALGVSTLPEQQQLDSDGPLPWLLLLLDGWEILHEESQTPTGSAVLDRVLRLLAEGQRLGLQAVVGGDRWAASSKAGRLMAHRYVLRFNEPSDYDAVGVRLAQVPATMPPGRAVDVTGRQYQIAALGDGTGAGQTAALRELALRIAARDADVPASARPTQIRALPSRLSVEELLAAQDRPAGTLPVALGVSAASGGPLWLDLAGEIRTLVVGGRRRSGRSTALAWMARCAVDAGARVVALCPKSSPLSSVEGAEVVAGADVAGAAPQRSDDGRWTLVLVDDADLVDPNHMGLMSLLGDSSPGCSVVVAGTTEFLKGQILGYLPMVRRSRSGLVLCPESPYDGQLLGSANLPRTQVFTAPEGRAVLGLAGEIDVVQLPL